MSPKSVLILLLIVIAGLQYRLWLGDGGIREYRETLQNQARLMCRLRR